MLRTGVNRTGRIERRVQVSCVGARVRRLGESKFSRKQVGGGCESHSLILHVKFIQFATTMNVSNRATLLAEVDQLIELELYESAETLATLFASHLTAVEFKPKASSEPIALLFAEVYEKLGDALFMKTEIKRALQYYRTAFHRRRAQQTKFRGGVGITNIDEARLRFKECKCQIELRDTANIIRDLETIPTSLRDTKMHVLLGDMYKRSGNRKKQAIQSYKDALLSAPLAIEVIEHLVALGVEAAEILSTLDEGLRHKDAGALASDGWMHTLVASLVSKRNHEHEKSVAGFQKLAAHFPKNTFLMTQQAALCVDTDQVDQGMVLYRQVCRCCRYIEY
jgi:tetratricopeptide (TPR) repeat protein